MEDSSILSSTDAVRLRMLRRIRDEAKRRFGAGRTAENVAYLVMQKAAACPDMSLRNCESEESWRKILETFDAVIAEQNIPSEPIKPDAGFDETDADELEAPANRF